MTAILVVDDSPVCRRITSAALAAHYSVDSVSDGREAVQAVRNRRYAAIVMDIDMPNINGIEATRLIRMIEQFNGERTIIIAYSASHLDRDAECLDAGMDTCVPKPTSAAELAAKLNAIIRTKAEAERCFHVRWTSTCA